MSLKRVEFAPTNDEFLTGVAALWAGARVDGRGYLTYPEWREFTRLAKAAQFICQYDLDRLLGSAVGAPSRSTQVYGGFMRALIMASIRRVKDGKDRGLTAEQLAASWNNELDVENERIRRQAEKDHEERLQRETEIAAERGGPKARPKRSLVLDRRAAREPVGSAL
jgi:hypothetical protein